MAYGAWLPWAQLLALTANVHRDTRKRQAPLTAADFHPLERRTASPGGLPLDGAMIDRLGDFFARAKGR